MNSLNLQNPQFLKFVTCIWKELPSGDVKIILQTVFHDLTILNLHYNDDIIENIQRWEHPGCKTMSSFKDLELEMYKNIDWKQLSYLKKLAAHERGQSKQQ